MSRKLALRGVVAFTLALTALAASASAASGPLALDVQVTDFPEPVRPLAGAGTTAFAVSVPCALFANAPEGGAPEVTVSPLAPSWADVVLTPPSFALHASECVPTGRVERAGVIVARTREHAPPFAPTAVTLHATLTGPLGAFHGNGTGLLTADYHAFLAVSPHDPARVADPGARVDVPVFVRNRGNGATAVSFTVDDAPAGWHASVPTTVTVDAAGSNADLATTHVRVRVPEDAGPGAGRIVVGFTSHYALDANATGDEGAFDVVVVVKPRLLPAPPALPALAALATAALAASRARAGTRLSHRPLTRRIQALRVREQAVTMGDASVDENKVKGIIGSAGKALAVNGRGKRYVERLESIASPEEFREFLEEAPLGLHGPAREEFIDDVTREDVWRDRASQLAYSVDMQKAEFWDANA